MEKLVLKFNESYQNFSGLSKTIGTVLTEPQDVTKILGADVTTYSFNIQLEEEVQVVIEHEGGEHQLTTISGEITVQARGLQFDPTIHKVGNEIFFNVNYKPGAEGVLLSAAKFQKVIVQKPVVTPFVFAQNLVEQNF